MFDGFPRETITFLQALESNNTRDWFEAHRQDYDRFYTAPALALIEALAPVAEALDPPHQAVPKLNKSLRRINRDTRFSKDKTPYSPRIHIVFWTGDHPNRSPGVHLVLAHDHFGYGAGAWGFDEATLAAYRASVGDDEKRRALNAALTGAQAVGCTLGEPELARVPRGFAATDETESLIRRKGIVARTHDVKGHDPRLFEPDCVAYIGGIMNALAPLDRWLCDLTEA